LATDRLTDKQMDRRHSPIALSRSRCREQLNNQSYDEIQKKCKKASQPECHKMSF